MGQYQKDYNSGTASEGMGKLVKCKELYEFTEGLAPIEQSGLWGYIDKTGEIVIPCRYNYAMSFSEGLAMVASDNIAEGFIDKKGNQVVPFDYMLANDFREGLAAVSDKEGEQFGYIDSSGKLVIPFQYSFADDFYDGLAAVSIMVDDKELTGFINRKGETVIDFKYYETGYFVDGYAVVEADEYDAIINKSGEEVFNLPHSDEFKLRSYGEAILWAENGSWFYQNLNTEEKRAMPDMKALSSAKDGLIIVENKNGKYGAIDKKGKEVIPFIYDCLEMPNEGFISFLQGSKWGYLDYSGSVIISPRYDEANIFSDGVAIVKKGRMKHVIDPKEQILFSIKKESTWRGLLKSDSVARKVLIRILILIAIFAAFYFLKN